MAVMSLRTLLSFALTRAALCVASSPFVVGAFAPQNAITCQLRLRSRDLSSWVSSLDFSKDSSDDNNNNNKASPVDPLRYYANSTDSDDNDNSDGIVTQEMLWRDMLEDPKVKRKNNKKKGGGGGYKVLDNRDSLPFMVKVTTPPPNPYKAAKKQTNNNNNMNNKKKKKRDGVSTRVASTTQDNAPGGSIKARLQQTDDRNNNQVLGEFHLDKSTTCGDIIEVGPLAYQVQKASCQYKYAGGKRFIMVRKILEVKEVTRVTQEDQLQRQYKRSKDEEGLPELE